MSGASSSPASSPSPASSTSESFGLLGDNGVSAGAFLASPFAADPTVPDIQITLFPAVSYIFEAVLFFFIRPFYLDDESSIVKQFS